MGTGARLIANTTACCQVINAASGALAGALTSIFVCPLDVLKTRLQVAHQSTRALGIFGGLAHIARTEGLKGACLVAR